MKGSNVIPLFVTPVAERVADKVVPPVRQPASLEEYSDVAAAQMKRDQTTSTIGTFLAVGAFAVAFYVVRDWRQTTVNKKAKA